MRQGPNNRRSRNRGGGNNGGGGGGGGGNGGGGGGGGNNNAGRRQNVPMRHQTFDSNGPDVRIRGNAWQVHEKYQALARDAASSGDRVMAENYLQHAEHYFRIITQIQEAESRQRENRGGNPGGGGGGNPGYNAQQPSQAPGEEDDSGPESEDGGDAGSERTAVSA